MRWPKRRSDGSRRDRGGAEEAPADDPLERFRHIGLAYLRWAMRNPTHFEISPAVAFSIMTSRQTYRGQTTN